MVTIEIPFVRTVKRKHGAAYSYRRQVPPDIRKIIGRKNWFKTWRRGTPFAVVEIDARQLAARHDAEIAQARGQEMKAEIQATEAEVRELLATDRQDAYETLAWAHATA